MIALSNGQAVITAKSESSGLEATCSVTVSTPVTGVSISSETETIIRGNSITLIANVLPETATNKNVTWKSSDTEVATVESDGMVTGIGVGSAVITVETVDWTDCYAGTEIGQEFVTDFQTVTGTKVRLIVDTLKGLNGAAIYEFEVYKIN